MIRIFYGFTFSFFLSITLWGQQISVMSYNVENLFDPTNDPLYNDDDFTPEGRHEWTYEKLDLKLQALSRVILSVENPGGRSCPDVLGLIEVENYEVLRLWKDHYIPECRYKHILIHRQDPSEPVLDDRRGIKVALMTRLDLDLDEPPTQHLVYQGTRYILEAPLRMGEHPLRVFVNHWRSRVRGGEENRARSAAFLRERLLKLNNEDPLMDIILMGDFNDEPENDSLRKVLGAQARFDEVFFDLTRLFIWNTSFDHFVLEDQLRQARAAISMGHIFDIEAFQARLRKARGTYYFRRTRDFYAIDHIMLTRGLFARQGWTYVEGSHQVYRHRDFTSAEGAPIPFSVNDFLEAEGASDHFPVLARFKLNP